MKLYNYDYWWKFVVAILSFLVAIQLIFNRQVHQITIYTYRVMQEYYEQNAGNFSSLLLLEQLVSVDEDGSKLLERRTKEFWTSASKKYTRLINCTPTLTHIFASDNSSVRFISVGGMWAPVACRSPSTVALIVPYRSREPHLKYFLPYMHSFLQTQMNAYQIFVIEQFGNETFNRAKLMNVGYVEARKLHHFDCYVFHDVDMLPLDMFNLYNCSRQGPLHMASAIDKWNFRMPYGGYFGGVCSFTDEQLRKINGFSNKFFGWGGEDDEIGMRISYSNQAVQRYPLNIGRYHMFRHGKDDGNDPNPERMKLLGQAHTSWRNDGLNTLDYKFIKADIRPYHTHILVDIAEKVQSTTSTTTIVPPKLIITSISRSNQSTANHLAEILNNATETEHNQQFENNSTSTD